MEDAECADGSLAGDVPLSRIKGRLAAAGLFGTEFHIVSKALKHPGRGQAYLSGELIKEARNEARNAHVLAEEGLMEAAVDRDNLAGRLAEAISHEEEIGFGLVGRGDGVLGQGPIGVETGELRGQRIGRLIIGVRNVVLRKRSNHSVAREHGRTLDDGRRGDAVDADQRGEFHGQLADEVVGGGLRGIVGDGPLLGHRGISARGEDEVTAEALFLPGDEGFVRDEVAAGDIEGEGQSPLVVRDMASGVRRDEDTRRDADGVKTTVGEGDLIQHLADRSSVHDVAAEADGRAAIREARAGDADADAVLGSDFLGRGLGGFDVLVDADDMGAFLDEAVGGFLTNTRASTDDDDDLTGEFLLGRHALEFGFFEEPILDIEGFLLRQGDILVDGFCAAHDFDGTVIEFSRDAGFGLILTPRNHAQARDEDNGRVRIAHGGRVRTLTGVVISGVVLAVLFETGGQLGLEGGDVFGLRIPSHIEGLDLRAEEVVRAGGAEFGEARGIDRVDETENLFVVLNGTDEALLHGDLTAQPRQDGREGGVTLLGFERLVLGAAEGLGVTALGLVLAIDIGRRLLDHGQSQLVAGLVVVRPRNEAVLAHHDSFDVRLGAGNILHGEAELEARAHPLHVSHFTSKNLLGQRLAILGGSNRDNRIRVHVVDMLAWQETVQRGINRRSARVEIERGVVIHRHHVVLGLGLQALVSAVRIDRLQANELILIEGGEILPEARAQVAARTLDPEHRGVLARQWVLFNNLGGGVAAARVGDALISAQLIGAVDQASHGIEFRRFGVVPEVGDVLVGRHGALLVKAGKGGLSRFMTSLNH